MYDVVDAATPKDFRHGGGIADVGHVEPIGLHRQRVTCAQVVEDECFNSLAAEGPEAGAAHVACAASQQYTHRSILQR